MAKKKGCEVLILGDFGCGAFANSPEIVAKVFKEALEIYGKYFETVEFAVYCAEEETRNYTIFKEVLEDFYLKKFNNKVETISRVKNTRDIVRCAIKSK